MGGKYQVRKVRRDGVSQRYWVAPTSEHEDAVIAVMGGDLATAKSRKEQELARELLQVPSVQESLYRSLVRLCEENVVNPMLFLQHYLARGYPEAEALLLRLATEPLDRGVRSAAVRAITTSYAPRAPRLIREVLDKAPDEWTARVAIDDLASALEITMYRLTTKGIMPSREAVLDALETLGDAMQGKWFNLQGGVIPLLNALNYSRSDFERAAHGEIPAPVEEKVIDGLMSVLTLPRVRTYDEFKYTLDVLKRWESAYSLPKLRSLLNGSLPQQYREMIIIAINEIEQRLTRKSG
jgi:hypothetical protein